ncbi:hypothetical protein [Paenibacillus agricola]|nr:hypothetical protein [Paenibacillus agricola]
MGVREVTMQAWSISLAGLAPRRRVGDPVGWVHRSLQDSLRRD